MSIDLKTIKDELEQREYETLSPYATKCKESKGRKNPRQDDYPIRTEFQRDRDRIIHSKAFRRLKHKTQVFLSPYNDHFRTRLTHTLEVSQIARTMARALKLNEDLVEAISLGHDLGHTPFGHCGEGILNELLPNGFFHNLQSVRVVEVLESHHDAGHGQVVIDQQIQKAGDHHGQQCQGCAQVLLFLAQPGSGCGFGVRHCLPP